MEVDNTISIFAVTQFVQDIYRFDIVSIYWNTHFHSIGLIKVTSPEQPSANDWRSEPSKRLKLKALNKAKILKATEVKIVPFKNRKDTGRTPLCFFLFPSSPPLCHKTSHSSLLETYIGQQGG